jgi:hypothetical protein
MPAPLATVRAAAAPRRSSRFVPLLMIALLTLVALLASLWLAAARSWAGDHGSKSYSSSSSGENTIRKETYRKTKSSTHHSISTDHGDWDGADEIDAYVFSREGGNWRSGSGSDRDWREVESLRGEMGDRDLLWFRRGGERYVITDRATLDGLVEIMAPQEELGRRQGELGRRQGELGRLQGELGRKQGQLGRMQADIALRQARLTQRMTLIGRGSSERDEIAREREDLEARQDEVSELQAELGEQQAKLGERQSVLGEQQAELGAEQARVSKEVQRVMTRIAREAIRDGRARQLD